MGNSFSTSLKVDEKQLMKERKLILFVDLDETLVQSVEQPSQKAAEREAAKSSHDARCFTGRRNQFIVSEIRPGAIQFLQELSPLFKMYVTTFGQLDYAKGVHRILDPENKSLERQIFTREYFEMDKTKDRVIEEFFSAEENLPFIAIDDRSEVWSRKHNVVCVKPYHGSSDTGPLVDKEDTYLEGLAKTLKQMHTEFFVRYEEIQEVPAMQEIKKGIRQLVLKDLNIHYIGKDAKKVYFNAKSLGANIHKDIVTKEDATSKGVSATTHIITASRPSSDIRSLAEQNGIYIVKGKWARSCYEMWRREDESNFAWRSTGTK